MTSKQFLKDKKVLITSFSYASFGGAELNAVELADQLVSFGAIPHFFSYDNDGPLAQHIYKKFGTKVITDDVNLLAENEAQNELGYTQLDINNYDYIWVGANTLPISIIKQLKTAKKIPKFVFIHMSPLISFPMDAPLLPELEKNIASKVLTISDRTTKDSISRILGDDIPLYTWANPAPREFRKLKKRQGQLSKIAIISSSHPTEEVMKAGASLENNGIQVDYIGRFNNNTRVIDEKFYDEYDLIVGIGKNVKYSLVSGVPVYVYGRFGGNGYLNKVNYDINENYNFSGRGFTKKTARQIAKEIIEGYPKALKFHELNRDAYIKKYSIDVIAENLFKELESEKSKKINLTDEHTSWLVSMQINFMQNMKRFAGLRSIEPRIDELESRCQQQESELRKLYNSHSWRLTRPVRSIIGLFRKAIKKQS